MVVGYRQLLPLTEVIDKCSDFGESGGTKVVDSSSTRSRLRRDSEHNYLILVQRGETLPEKWWDCG